MKGSKPSAERRAPSAVYAGMLRFYQLARRRCFCVDVEAAVVWVRHWPTGSWDIVRGEDAVTELEAEALVGVEEWAEYLETLCFGVPRAEVGPKNPRGVRCQ